MARGNREIALMPNQTGRQVSGVPARQQLLKRHNLSLVLRQIAISRRLSRAQLAAQPASPKRRSRHWSMLSWMPDC